MLIFGLGYGLGWFPTAGGYEQSTPGFNWAFIYDVISHAFLPALTLMIITPIGWILGMRNTMIMNLNEDYIKLAKAKGLPDRTVALRYAARNALLPSVTGFALALGAVLGGTILVETVFDYPGLGRLMGEAVGLKDYPLLQALMLLTAVATLVANLIADLLYGVLGPAGPEGRGMRRRPMTTVGSDFMAEGAPDQQEAVEEVGGSRRAPGGLVQRHLEQQEGPGRHHHRRDLRAGGDLRTTDRAVLADRRVLRAAGSAVASTSARAPMSAARTSCPS